MADASNATLSAKPPLNLTVRLELSVMMFLQFAIWGSWFVILGNYLDGLDPQKFTKEVIGGIYGTMALGTIFAPLFVGQIADRFFASEKLMAVLHLAGAGLLYWMGQIHDPATFYVVSLLYALIYSPTLALSNSIAFAHSDGNRDFAGLRVLGTVGWIAANLIVGTVLKIKTDAGAPLVPNAPFLVGAALSLALGIFSLALPHTPPPGKAGAAFPFLKAVGLLKDFSFGVFFGVSFVITIVLAFYYGFTGLYLEKGVGVHQDNVGSLMSIIGQGAELLLLPFLPWFLKRWGMKTVLVLGMLCWGIRYFLFSIYAQQGLEALFPLVLVGIALHGICFDFFFAAGFIYVDNTAPPDIRGSGQALFTFLTYGLGMWLGNVISGMLAGHYTTNVLSATTGLPLLDGKGNNITQTDWAAFWFWPAIGVLICSAVFMLFFRVDKPGALSTSRDGRRAGSVSDDEV